MPQKPECCRDPTSHDPCRVFDGSRAHDPSPNGCKRLDEKEENGRGRGGNSLTSGPGLRLPLFLLHVDPHQQTVVTYAVSLEPLCVEVDLLQEGRPPRGTK